MKKIILFPIRMILMFASVLIDLFIKAECWVSGIAFVILTVCIILAVVNQMWLQAKEAENGFNKLP